MTAPAPEAITWWQDDPERLDAELMAMGEAAPQLEWFDEGLGGWHGEVPLWPFERPQPRGLERLVGQRPLSVRVFCRPVHPMMAPIVRPLGVDVPLEALGYNTWHLLPSGSLCLLRGTAWWDPARLVADLIPKISGWYIEYHLMKRECLKRMPDRGVDLDDALDAVIDNCATRVG
jgi:hypothetical protein